jgi:hypothetical protein
MHFVQAQLDQAPINLALIVTFECDDALVDGVLLPTILFYTVDSEVHCWQYRADQEEDRNNDYYNLLKHFCRLSS